MPRIDLILSAADVAEKALNDPGRDRQLILEALISQVRHHAVRDPPSDSDVLGELRAEFADLDASGGSSNDVAQWLDDFLTARGLPTVLYA